MSALPKYLSLFISLRSALAAAIKPNILTDLFSFPIHRGAHRIPFPWRNHVVNLKWNRNAVLLSTIQSVIYLKYAFVPFFLHFSAPVRARAPHRRCLVGNTQLLVFNFNPFSAVCVRNAIPNNVKLVASHHIAQLLNFKCAIVAWSVGQTLCQHTRNNKRKSIRNFLASVVSQRSKRVISLENGNNNLKKKRMLKPFLRTPALRGIQIVRPRQPSLNLPHRPNSQQKKKLQLNSTISASVGC